MFITIENVVGKNEELGRAVYINGTKQKQFLVTASAAKVADAVFSHCIGRRCNRCADTVISQAWAQYLHKNIDCLEKVQRRATKFVKGLNKHKHEDVLRLLG